MALYCSAILHVVNQKACNQMGTVGDGQRCKGAVQAPLAQLLVNNQVLPSGDWQQGCRPAGISGRSSPVWCRPAMCVTLRSMAPSSVLSPVCSGPPGACFLARLSLSRQPSPCSRSSSLPTHFRTPTHQMAIAEGGSAEAAALAAAAAGSPAAAVTPCLVALALRQHPRIILGTGSSSRRGGCLAGQQHVLPGRVATAHWRAQPLARVV